MASLLTEEQHRSDQDASRKSRGPGVPGEREPVGIAYQTLHSTATRSRALNFSSADGYQKAASSTRRQYLYSTKTFIVKAIRALKKKR